ncbi:hypothetical protein PV10_04730 [Exophiala mesophila]|uniref:DUF614 domain protein n=1 Tax=Exophiala mesophila TaxID=212818 RepID=A0A0D1WW01_EXOME|nr:uncharacterized protein PV10_04730 [Exophiala mesophila]KIV93520.1 hypothetical protein PV10_04730 [Exophiala mesophila]
MKNYEYPQVRPPTSLQPPRFPSHDNRFSWMDATADEEHRLWTRNTRRPSNIAAPAALSPLEETSAQPMPTMNTPQQDHEHPPYPYPGHEPLTQYANDSSVQQHPISSPPQSQPQPAQRVRSQATYSIMPFIPEPTKHAVPKDEPAASIAPDANPLTPTTPKFNRPSTNMAIIPPPDPSQYTISSFTPSPQVIRGGTWQHGLGSCAEPTTCLTGLFCPCIVYGRTQYRLGLRQDKKDPTNMLGYTAVNGSCIAFGLLCGINGILAAIQHSRVRRTYNMSTEAGNVAGDCLKGICCCCCVVAQDEKEVAYREGQARKASGLKQEGYVAPTSMAYGAPPS